MLLVFKGGNDDPQSYENSIMLAPASQRKGGVSAGGVSSPHHPVSHRAFPGHLMPSHFVSDAGQNRGGGSITPDFSQRRGRVSLDNVTQRDTKRPSERPRDREYHRRFSIGLPQSHVSPPCPLGGHTWPREDSFSPPARSVVEAEIGLPAALSYGERDRNNGKAGQSRDGRSAGTAYHIRLICDGDSVQHVVWPSMPISDLIEDAGHIFGLDPAGISLVLFSATPVTLRRESTIFGPPLVAQNSSVMVFSFHPQPLPAYQSPAPAYGPRTPSTQALVVPGGFTYAAPPVNPFVSSKLLSTFKLPKFDGASKNWKTWDRAFQRFLGLHQLDHVLEDGFLATVWNVPGAKEANKFVYFLLEDSVAAGSLASKYIRQAVKWNGHEAYVLLHDGYVFSGPQSATILLSELSQLRLKRDENPSLFCMRLVELVEDLEAIPGNSAVFLTEQQKLGYLLSAIRHESGLQSVYSQLQSEQLRGTITFDQACRELHFRCEAIRADEFLDSRPGKALFATESEKIAGMSLLSTELKKKGQDGQPKAKLECLKNGCPTMIPAYLPLCKSCYLECMAGKTVSIVLRDSLGTATYNSGTKKIDFPVSVPNSRFPKQGIKRKALLANWKGLPSCEDRSGIFGASTVMVLFAGPVASLPIKPVNSTCLAASVFDGTLFYVDSGAGQCMCSCDSAFIQMSPCEIEITGVAGSLQIYGIGTALFVARDDQGHEVILRIHNCLFSHGKFNLISVSQLCGKPKNSVNLSIDSPALSLMSSGQKGRWVSIPLHLDDGLFAVRFDAIQVDDPRFVHLPKCDVTPGGDFVLATSDTASRWRSKVLVTASRSARILVAPHDYHWNLESFCGDFLAPPSLPPAKRTYSSTNPDDLTDLSIRFFGVGTQRLIKTIAISNGLSSTASRKVVPTHIFPPGRWKESKTPRVSKGKLVNLPEASPGEVLFSDTFVSGDSKYKYGQVFYDYASGYGDILPIRSRNDVGTALEDFCCRNWIPLCIVSDNAGENTGGDLEDVARRLSIQRVFICPRHPMQNYAEGYLGRITAMASFAMVHAGAPLFMWIYSIKAAVFTNNIAAKFYRLKDLWAQPYQVMHGETFADSSIVVPFGCGALILRDSDDRPKFQTRCTLMIFLHYADEHPLFTYAFFSPRTKRVLYRQDAIFLPTLFPMRLARQASGLAAEGDALVTFRSPVSLREGSDPELSFGNWVESDLLPAYEDDVTGFSLGSPSGPLVHEPQEIPDLPVHIPDHPSFPPSVVVVPIPASSMIQPNLGPVSASTDPGAPVETPDGTVEMSTAGVPSLSGISPLWATFPQESSAENDVSSNPGGEDGTPEAPAGKRARVRLGLTLTFPDGERHDQRYSAHPAWTVPYFKERMGRLLETSSPIKLLVGPGWEELDHLGLIGDTYLPGLGLRCPFLMHNSVVRVSQCPSWSGGRISPGFPLRITISFPDGERESQDYSLHRHILVPQFKMAMASLLDTTSPVILTVSPSWEVLDHLGPVSALVFPGSAELCPHLTQGSHVRVQCRSTVMRDHEEGPQPSVPHAGSPAKRLCGSDDADELTTLDGLVRVTPAEVRTLRTAFRKEAKKERSAFKDSLVQEWRMAYPSREDKENPGSSTAADYEDDECAFDHFISVRMQSHDRWAAEKKATFLASLVTQPTPTLDLSDLSVRLRQERVEALWEGLRRVYFGEVEAPDGSEDGHSPGTRASLQNDNLVLRREIATLMERLRRRGIRVHDTPPLSIGSRDRDPDDSSPGGASAAHPPHGVSTEGTTQPIPIPQSSEPRSSQSEREEGSPPRRSHRIRNQAERPTQTADACPTSHRRVSQRYFYETVPAENGSANQTGLLAKCQDDGVSNAEVSPSGFSDSPISTNQGSPSQLNQVGRFFLRSNGDSASGTPYERKILLSSRTIRKVLAAKETLFKFGTFVPRNESEALRSPEAHRWIAGRDLEWLRMGQRETFGRDWTWNRIQREFPEYLKSDIGHLFYVFDYKYSGEHRVRLVFDGSRQSPSTYTETYAPAARQESVRLFHIILVEEGYCMGQYDVPQAFLLAPIDTDIFVYPPNGQSEYVGQILKLRKALYGGKQSAFLWFQMINTFILELGFVASPMDSCLYKRDDAILILYCDDLRIGASSIVLASLQAAFFSKFAITTAPGDRFLGMDTVYQRDLGYLKLSMTTYIDSTIARFADFDLSCGVPFRELVGCLLWITLCVLGPELLRVKDLARRSNSFTSSDYEDGLKVLKRISERKLHGIVIYRNAATREILPAYSRPSFDDPPQVHDVGDFLASPDGSEVTLKSLCQAKAIVSLPSSPANGDDSVSTSLPYVVPDDDAIDIPRMELPVNPRYRLLAFGDASFAIGVLKQSVSGFVIYLNGVPLMWGSLKQTIVVDSSCSAEFVAASIVTKQILNAENMIAFFGFSCPKPYRLYTDSMACLHIGTNPAKLGNVRHLHIRYHLVRCVVSFGDIAMFFCVTEAMIADLFTKIVSGAQDTRLSVRFYSLLPESSGLVLGISPMDPTTSASRVSAFLYPEVLAIL